MGINIFSFLLLLTLHCSTSHSFDSVCLFCFFNVFLINFLPAAGKLFNLWAVFFLSQSGQFGIKLLSIVLLHIRNILSYLPYDLSIDTWEMLQFLMQLVPFGIGDSCLLLLQLPLSKLLKLPFMCLTSFIVAETANFSISPLTCSVSACLFFFFFFFFFFFLIDSSIRVFLCFL